MKGSLYFGAVRGIKMYLHWTFSLLIIWVVGSHLNEGGDAVSLLDQLLFIFSVFGCVLLHELGHALSALRYGIRTHDITLLPIGGVARLEKIPEKPSQELVVAAAGPAVNVFIALILYVVLLLSGSLPDTLDPSVIEEAGLAVNLLLVNITLVVFNLIPAFPMDGGRMLRALLGMKLRRDKATRIAAGIGQLLAVGFIIFGYFYNPMLMFIGLFIFMGARQESLHVTRTEMLKDVRVKDVMLTNFRVLNANDTLRAAVDLLLAGDQQDFLLKNEEGEITGLLTRNALLKGISSHGLDFPAGSLSEPVLKNIAETDSAREIYQQMMESNVPAAPVYNDSVITGMLTVSNIREYFLVKYAVQLHQS